ncbi:splicing factor 3B subunit 1-like [Dorcoceras hygrometricum]|uniref:Splicing factor 3B subunit 1-like n=1 Tax=Dorcoceras hygrometricum TaxID=472368 RepID=A0A2Z7CCL2_9LAMI|nr:splicing factor 3B subunit 1-like [Dorcoceras hygrometricum]
MGIYQQTLHSVQLDYLKVLQRPTQTKAAQKGKNKTRSNLSTKSNIQQLSDTHATYHEVSCMRDTKNQRWLSRLSDKIGFLHTATQLANRDSAIPDFVELVVTRSAEIEFEHSIAVNDEDDNLDGAENEIARKMASSTALKQFLKEPLRSREDDDMSGSKKPSKIIEPATTEKDKEIEPVATEYLSLAKSVATMTDSEDTEPLSKVLELTDKSKSDEESMPIEDILKQIPEEMVTPSSNQARGFAVQNCVLLQGVPDLALCEPKPFPTLKALNVKTVGTYVSKQKGIDGNERDESVMATAALVKKKPVTKKRTSPTTVEPVAKKKRLL